MKTEILHKKLTRYIDGHALPAETKQIQNWLSIVDKSELQMSENDKITLEEEILAEIQAYTAYPLLFPKSKPWWHRITGA
ncbi:MAG: hypothetical protein JNL23_09005 [Chitinophagaceae bacterium]|nr:hypothetical protein [Chitinophagaceae bacterium]